VLVALSGFHLARVDGAVLRRAAHPFQTLVRTLDAIHLATALMAQVEYDDLVFATHDRQLGMAARAVGLTVIDAPP
jgi:hypothetical protein